MKAPEISETPLSPVGSGQRIVGVADDCLFFNSLGLQDPNQNRIGQWLDVRPKQGIADLSFQLAAEISLGTYTINVVNPKASSTFKVEEHGKMEYGEQRMEWEKLLASVCVTIYSQRL